MAVERLPGNAEFGARLSHIRFLLPQGGHGQAHLSLRHFEGRAASSSTVSREHLETDAACAEVVNDIDEVAQVAAQPIELPNDQGVPAAQGLEGCVESGPRIETAGGAVLVKPARCNSGGPKSVALSTPACSSVQLFRRCRHSCWSYGANSILKDMSKRCSISSPVAKRHERPRCLPSMGKGTKVPVSARSLSGLPGRCGAWERSLLAWKRASAC